MLVYQRVAPKRDIISHGFRHDFRVGIPQVPPGQEAYDRWLQETGQQAADDITVLVVDLTARDIKAQSEWSGAGFMADADMIAHTHIYDYIYTRIYIIYIYICNIE